MIDCDSDGVSDVVLREGDADPLWYCLSGFTSEDAIEPAVTGLPFPIHAVGDVTGDSIPDIARFLTDDDGDDVLAVQAMPVEGELADQPWDIVLGGVVRYDWIDLEDRFVGGGWDHNADGINDMAVGAFTLTEDEGQVYVYDGPITEARTTDEADATLARFGSRCGADGTYRGCDQVGTYTKSAGDLDGDGYTDIAIASRGSYVDDMKFAGTVWILSGPLAGPMHIEAEATGTILGEVDHSYMPTEMFTGGDLDGDGRDELVLAHQDARLFHGPVEGTRVYSDGITFIDMSWDPAYHITFDADVDGDAIDDIAMIHYTYSGMAGMHVWFSTLSDEWPRPWAL